MQSTDL